MSKVVENFMEMVKIDSESDNVKKFTDYIAQKFADLGGKIYKDEKSLKYTKTNAPNIIVHFEGNTKSSVIGLSAHVDTVVPGKGIKPVLKDGVITSSGDTILGSDDKSGIVAIYTAIKNIVDNNQKMRECYVILTVSEEIGLLGAKYLDKELIKNVENIIVFDSGGAFGEVIVSAPSQNSIYAIVKGKAAHAGVEPEKGVNAIFAAACGISKLKLGRIDNETTCNIGIINGGKATNIVPDRVIIEGEVRSRDDKKLKEVTENIVSILKLEVEKANASIKIDVVNEYKSYN
ncbi:MAG: M20/M25/M40 family metallo-hydrolase, partial [Candidatus Muirbacterium halophilum]|nr:M20/M25/M40 family metallo-hydrolase [Candidatus Muirbacterium halophilum]